ncbi:hypothetical protein [Lysobacter enzymogenes]|uniref:hypothetical protein n=1 Tax=Lysobacter enzymogenes TaxID=69 RepID=UPI001AF33D0A|nr:hypothetical protein [Lysobacter enzymogenes]QQP99476.1 hypothetical protein JHW41_15255 [Lysobacter enzymogenes]
MATLSILYWLNELRTAPLPPIRYFIVILCGCEQLTKVGMQIRAGWDIVDCIYTADTVETPMAPNMAMHNVLGVEGGGWRLT